MLTTEFFNVKEHSVPACHVREYAGCTSTSQNDVLYMHVKQYIPRLAVPKTSEDSVTIISAPGVGLPKELYEPLWDEFYKQSYRNGFSIRSIWIAEAVNFGKSGILNEGKLSNEYCWLDHARDLLSMINQFRDQMPRPIVGLGHSFGACQLINLAYLHPRLFTTLIVLDPVVQLSPTAMGLGNDPPGLVNYTLYRQDVWPNRAAAAAAHKKVAKFWDKRVVELMVKYGFRDLPTALYPLPPDIDSDDPPVTLTTSKYYDLIAQLRANFEKQMSDGRYRVNKETHADLDPELATLPFCRPETQSTWRQLPSLRPSTLFVLGEKTYLNLKEMREGIQRAGAGVGGSGGMAEKQVKEILLPDQPHVFPFIAVEQTAVICSEWLGAELDKFWKREKVWETKRAGMSKRDHLTVDSRWNDLILPMSAFKHKM